MEMVARKAPIAGRTHTGNWVVAERGYPPAMLVGAFAPKSFGPLRLADITAEHLPPLGTELLLLGTGAQLERLPEALLALAESRQLQIEVMDSNAAARTFNLLMLEDRAVAALLL